LETVGDSRRWSHGVVNLVFQDLYGRIKSVRAMQRWRLRARKYATMGIRLSTFSGMLTDAERMDDALVHGDESDAKRARGSLRQRGHATRNPRVIHFIITNDLSDIEDYHGRF
jgi:hypothetical protein